MTTLSVFTGAPHLTPSYASPHSLSPSRSPKRHHRQLSDHVAPFMRDFSPTMVLHAFTSASQAPRMSESYDSNMRNNLSNASFYERAFGVRAAETSRKLRAWCRELEEWNWPGYFGPSTLSVDSERETHPVAVGYKQDSPHKGHEKHSRDQGAADPRSYSSLPAQQVRRYERRINAIQEEMNSLNIEELKEHVLQFHADPSSPPVSAFGRKRVDFSSRAPQYKPLDDVETLMTVTLLDLLPYISRLRELLSSWSTRVAVLRRVPHFLQGLTELETAIDAGWRAIRGTHQNPTINSKNFDVPGAAFVAIRDILANRVADVGRRLDEMLDLIEGRPETIPELWIDNFELLEQQFVAWVVEAEHRVMETKLRLARRYDESDNVQTQTRNGSSDTNVGASNATQRLTGHERTSQVEGQTVDGNDSRAEMQTPVMVEVTVESATVPPISNRTGQGLKPAEHLNNVHQHDPSGPFNTIAPGFATSTISHPDAAVQRHVPPPGASLIENQGLSSTVCQSVTLHKSAEGSMSRRHSPPSLRNLDPATAADEKEHSVLAASSGSLGASDNILRQFGNLSITHITASESLDLGATKRTDRTDTTLQLCRTRSMSSRGSRPSPHSSPVAKPVLAATDESKWSMVPSLANDGPEESSTCGGSDSEILSRRPSLLAESSAVPSPTLAEDSDGSKSSYSEVEFPEYPEYAEDDLKHKHPRSNISTKERYAYDTKLTTLPEVLTPGSAGYISDISSAEIGQAQAAEYFVPMKVNSPSVRRSASSSCSPSPAIVSKARRSNSANAVLDADRASLSNLRLQIPGGSRQLRAALEDNMVQRKQSHRTPTRPSGLKRASVTSIESISRFQIKSVDIKRHSSASSAASTVRNRVSGETQSPCASSPSSPRRSGERAEHNRDPESPQSPSSSPIAPSFDNSPSLRVSARTSDTVLPGPALSVHVRKRRDLQPPSPTRMVTFRSPSNEQANQECSPINAKLEEHKLDRRVATILRSISNRIEITPATADDNSRRPLQQLHTPKSAMHQGFHTMKNSPTITLSPASAQDANSRHKGESSDIKFYYLKEPGKKDKLLTVRENNNMVVVRVGGGWEELGYHLRTHYGQRSLSHSNVEFQGLPHASATLAPDSSFSGHLHNRPATADGWRTSAQKFAPAVKLALTTAIPTTPASERLPSKRRSLSPAPPASEPSRLSWFCGDEQPSLAGPFAKKADALGEGGEEWVRQMLERAGRARTENEKPRAGAGAGERRIEFGEIGRAGATRRFFIKRGVAGVELS